MPIAARWRSLDRLPPVRGRDAMPGVYEIADERRSVIYIGQSAVDVPNRIRQHLAKGGCVATNAGFWRYAYSAVPQAEEARLLDDYRAAHSGALPRCNRATPLVRDARRRASERFGGGNGQE
ncbi:MAG: GIY-YIG nuclease family protein [Trueperaceae bacterium]|nr:GIY-YIG nuclease family protein [Truepera sp.]HRN18936.1 GIY-YIG nuclease family protein [Trueperaceae bacterium]HRQ10144.1 GIY-YIG nuclease family protein [Trueperaceae bacterium]